MHELLTLKLPGTNDTSTVINLPGGIPTGGLEGDGGKLIPTIIELLLFAVVVLALIIIIYSGIQYILAQGDKTKIQNARNRLIYAIVGLILAFLSFAIISIVGNLFKIDYLGGIAF